MNLSQSPYSNGNLENRATNRRKVRLLQVKLTTSVCIGRFSLVSKAVKFIKPIW